MWPYSERSSTVGNKMRLLNVQKKKKKNTLQPFSNEQKDS